MFEIECEIVGQSPISFSKFINKKKKTGQSHEAFEEQTWRERLHVDEKGEVFIPAIAIKNMMVECARYLSETVPGKGKATYTKHMEAGMMVLDPVKLKVKAKDVQPEGLFVPSDGKRGGGSRVYKMFPTIPAGWKGKVKATVFDRCLKPEKIKEYLEQSGMFIGLLRWRPRNNGLYGRFTVKNFKVTKNDDE